MRIVIDTNVIISALFFGGLPDKFLELVFDGKIHAVGNFQIIKEYIDTYEELSKKLERRTLKRNLREVIEKLKTIVVTTNLKICRDPDDDKFINCAIDGKCKYIVSGDNDLLEIGSVANVEIVTVRDFMEEYKIGERKK